METNKTVKKLKNFISATSKEFFTALLEDDPKEKKEQEIIFQKITRGKDNQILVVLHVINEKEIRSFSGFILKVTKETILLKPLDEKSSLKLIQVKNIKKVSMLETVTEQKKRQLI